MSAVDVLADLARAGVSLYLAEGGRLRARAKPGSLTAAARAAIDRHRADLVALLADPLAITVANASALPPDERDGWQREIVAALRWAESGHDPDHFLAHDLVALRRLVLAGTCLDCGSPAPRDGGHWCDACRTNRSPNA